MEYTNIEFVIGRQNCRETNYEAENCEFFATIESNEDLNVEGAVSRQIYRVFLVH